MSLYGQEVISIIIHRTPQSKMPGNVHNIPWETSQRGTKSCWASPQHYRAALLWSLRLSGSGYPSHNQTDHIWVHTIIFSFCVFLRLDYVSLDGVIVSQVTHSTCVVLNSSKVAECTKVAWTFTMIDWREEVRKNMKKRHTANYTSMFPQQTFWSGRRLLLCRGVRWLLSKAPPGRSCSQKMVPLT